MWRFYYIVLNQMIEITDNDRKAIDFTEKIVSEYFNVGLNEVASRNHKRDASLARGFIWYILHYNYDLSISKLSIEYYRNRRSINYLIAKIKIAVKKQVSYKEMYKAIKIKMGIE